MEMTNHSDSEIKGIFNEAMSSGFETSEDYLKLWHAYLDYLKRSMLANFETETEARKEEIMETIRDTFEKAISQLYECNIFNIFCKKEKVILNKLRFF